MEWSRGPGKCVPFHPYQEGEPEAFCVLERSSVHIEMKHCVYLLYWPSDISALTLGHYVFWMDGLSGHCTEHHIVSYIHDIMLVEPDVQEVDVGSFAGTHVFLKVRDKSSKGLGIYHIRCDYMMSQETLEAAEDCPPQHAHPFKGKIQETAWMETTRLTLEEFPRGSISKIHKELRDLLIWPWSWL